MAEQVQERYQGLKRQLAGVVSLLHMFVCSHCSRISQLVNLSFALICKCVFDLLKQGPRPRADDGSDYADMKQQVIECHSLRYHLSMLYNCIYVVTELGSSPV